MARIDEGQSFGLGGVVLFSEQDSFLALPPLEDGRVLQQQVILLGGPLELFVPVGVQLVEGPDVARHPVELADYHREGGPILLGENREQLCQFGQGEIGGRQLHLGGGGHALGVHLLVEVRQQILDFPCQLHLM